MRRRQRTVRNWNVAAIAKDGSHGAEHFGRGDWRVIRGEAVAPRDEKAPVGVARLGYDTMREEAGVASV